MKLYADTQEQAQALADRAHRYLIATDPAYADSAALEHTLRWDVPKQDEAGWYIAVESRCLGAFTPEELLRLDPPQDQA